MRHSQMSKATDIYIYIGDGVFDDINRKIATNYIARFANTFPRYLFAFIFLCIGRTFKFETIFVIETAQMKIDILLSGKIIVRCIVFRSEHFSKVDTHISHE